MKKKDKTIAQYAKRKINKGHEKKKKERKKEGKNDK